MTLTNWPADVERMALIFLVFSFTASICHGAPRKTQQLPWAERPATWAAPMEKDGLPNLFQVSSNLFRGAQPTRPGMLQLKAMGAKTIVSLRGFHDDEDLIEGTTLAKIRIRFHTWHPEEEDMLRFLKVIADPDRQPVFVHCRRGVDRTGTMVAIYRMCIQGWPKEEAIREMTRGRFGYDDKFPNLVEYLRNLDVDKLKEKAGLTSVPKSNRTESWSPTQSPAGKAA